MAGEVGRAVLLYEVALNYEINAINAVIQEDEILPEGLSLHQLYANAVFYAQSCGRTRKAEHLQAKAAKLKTSELSENES